MRRPSCVTARRSTRGTAIELCQIALQQLQAGDHTRISELVEKAVLASTAAAEPLLVDLLAAARHVTEVWTTLHGDLARGQEALVDAQARAAKLQDHLKSLLQLAVDSAPAMTYGAVVRCNDFAPDETAVDANVLAERTDDRHLPSAISPAMGEAKIAPANGIAPTLKVYMLRPFQLEVNGRSIEDWPNCKAKSLFKYLLINRDRPATKESLMELFWPDADPEAARNNLNVGLYNLRSVLRQIEPTFPFVVHDGGRYVLNRALHISLDADEYLARIRRAEELERAGDLEEAMRAHEAAIELYRDELLAEDRYEEWIAPFRDQFRDNLATVLASLSSHYFTRGDFGRCVSAGRRLLTIDSCNEEAHRQLMRCYAALSQPQLAQLQYRACVVALSREMGIPPSQETTELYRRIARREIV